MSVESNNKLQYFNRFKAEDNKNHDAAISQTIKIDSINDLEEISKTKRKIESITQYLKPHISKMLNEVLQVNPINAKVICEYIIAEQNEINIRESTKETKIKKIVHLSKYFQHQKTFYEMTRDDILDYLNSIRKPVSIDPTHRSIGTWNARQMLFLKFFRWLQNPNEQDLRKRETPQCMKGIKQLPRKEKSPYKPDDKIRIKKW